MAAQAPMIRALDEAPLTARFWILAGAVMLGAVLDLFDFFLIAFIVPILADDWNLTFGQAAAMLLGAGFGAIGGSILFGRLGDRHGRKLPLVAGILTFSFGTGAMAAAPDGGWWFLASLRVIVGAGVAGVAVIAVPLALEFTPTRLRTRITGFVTTGMVPIGVLAAALAAGLLEPVVGWRALFAIGVLPAALAVFVAYYVPESPRWLVGQGRLEEARRVVAWLLMRPEEELSLEAPSAPRNHEGTRLADVLRYRRSVTATVLAWFGASAAVSGVVLWGPTFLEKILNTSSHHAALLFAIATVGSFAGRLFFSFMPQRTGRRLCGMLMGFGATPLLVLAAYSSDTKLAGASLFLLALVVGAFFLDGGFANLTPYTPEVFPTNMRTQGMGLAWAAGGVGRVIGPLGVGLIAGTGSLVNPEATLNALTPAFLYLAFFSLLVGLAFVLVDIEPHGKDLETLTEELLEDAAARELVADVGTLD
jgi:putative MFS transporter